MEIPKKLTIDIIKERVKTKSPNTLLLSEKYVNAKTKLKCKCKICSHKWEVIWDSLNRGRGCPICSGNQQKTIEDIKKYTFENSCCELLSNKYVNVSEKLLFRCSCGNEFKRSFNDFKVKNKNCPDCSYKKTGKINSATDEEIQSVVDSRGHKLLKRFSDKHFTKIDVMDKKGYKYRLVYTDYKQNDIGVVFGGKNYFSKYNIRKFFKDNSPDYKLINIFNGKSGHNVTFECDAGHKNNMYFYNFKKGVRCSKCFYIRNSAENHPNYRDDLTDEDRSQKRYLLHGKNIRKWSRKVHEKHNFKCVICSSNHKIEAHHLESWNLNKSLRFDTDNGVTLCKHHHIMFHKTYGFGFNTTKQFYDFKKMKGIVTQ